MQLQLQSADMLVLQRLQPMTLLIFSNSQPMTLHRKGHETHGHCLKFCIGQP